MLKESVDALGIKSVTRLHRLSGMPPRKRNRSQRSLTPLDPTRIAQEAATSLNVRAPTQTVHAVQESTSSFNPRAPILPSIEAMTTSPSDLAMNASAMSMPFRVTALDHGYQPSTSTHKTLDLTQPPISNASFRSFPTPPLSGLNQGGFPWTHGQHSKYIQTHNPTNQEVYHYLEQQSPSYRGERTQVFPQPIQSQLGSPGYFHGNKHFREEHEHRDEPLPKCSPDLISDRSYAPSSLTGTPQDTGIYSQSPGSFREATPRSNAPSALGKMLPQTASSVRQASLSPATRSKYSLFLRQQPRSARAGPEGRDRRPIDPPVILQLQIMDFDLNNEDHLNDVKNPFWVCHCLLYSADSPRQHVTVVDDGPSREGSNGLRRLLIGELIATAVLAPEDPDPETAVPHPSSNITATTSNDQSFRSQPGVFFIFSDISVRMPGRYRLSFSLMKMTPVGVEEGQQTPVVATVTSQPFIVVNAKGFDKVQESTKLVHGLAKLPNAPATMKIKKGPAAREKAKQRREEEDSDSDGSD